MDVARFSGSVLLGALVGFGSVSTAHAQATFEELGDLPGGDVDSHPFDISDDGSFVVGFGDNGSFLEAFRWQGGSMIGLGVVPGDGASQGWGVSNDGSAVAGFSIGAGGEEAFRWDDLGGMVGLGFLPGGSISVGWDISGDGSVVVGQSDTALSVHAFRWTAGSGMVSLGVIPGGSFSAAFGASDDGNSVVGLGNSASGPEAFRWTLATGMVGLGDLPGGRHFSHAFGVSGDGAVAVGGSSSSSSTGALDTEAFRWTEAEGMVGLGFLPGHDSSRAWAASFDGSIIGGDNGDFAEAFLWDSTTHCMRSLQDLLANELGLAAEVAGWTLLSVFGISGDGKTLVGFGDSPHGGHHEGWIATIPELPLGVECAVVEQDAALSIPIPVFDTSLGTLERADLRVTLEAGSTFDAAPHTHPHPTAAASETTSADPGHVHAASFAGASGSGLTLPGFAFAPDAVVGTTHEIAAGTTTTSAAGSHAHDYEDQVTILGFTDPDLAPFLGATDFSIPGPVDSDAGDSLHDHCYAGCSLFVDPGGSHSHGSGHEAWSSQAIFTWTPFACRDGLDNDGDGEIDFGANCSDPGGADCGCASLQDDSELDETGTYLCDDGIDNDGDGLTDFTGLDPGCPKPAGLQEDPACNDGNHNDFDDLIDFDGGAEASQGGALCTTSETPFQCCTGPGSGCDGPPDPQCVNTPWKDREKPGFCGLGFEVALLLPGFLGVRRRRGDPWA